MNSPAAPTRATAVAAELRQMIMSGELPAGSRLRQVEVAARFGVSTTPVREAFMWLVRHGLADYDSHRGYVVFSPSLEDVKENWELRGALEPLAAEHAARKITAAQLAELDDIVAQMSAALDCDEISLFVTELNPRFHANISAAADRPRLAEMIESLRNAAFGYQGLIGVDRGAISAEVKTEELRQHAEIVSALRARAPKRAAKAIHQHLEYNLAAVIRSLKDGDASVLS